MIVDKFGSNGYLSKPETKHLKKELTKPGTQARCSNVESRDVLLYSQDLLGSHPGLAAGA